MTCQFFGRLHSQPLKEEEFNTFSDTAVSQSNKKNGLVSFLFPLKTVDLDTSPTYSNPLRPHKIVI